MIDRLIRQRTRILAISFGIVYLWFGGLKFFPGMSPAESLAKETLGIITFGLVPSSISYCMLALWEVSIGICLLLNFRGKVIIYLTMLHLVFTFTPLFLLQDASFKYYFYSLTLVGQYIIKNLVFLCALLFLIPEKPKSTRVLH